MKREVITHRMPKSPASESFRTLRTNIQFMNTKNGLKSLMITSTLPGEGKSWVAANLAVTFAQAGKKVTLVDCDLRLGRQFAIFGVAPTPGISNYLSGVNTNGQDCSDNILEYIKPTEVENLFLLPAGNVPPNPSELLTSERMAECVEKLKSYSDLVIFDTTPSCLVTDAVVISRYVDTSIIVASYKNTRTEDIKKIKREIENVGGKIAGVVINKVRVKQSKYGYGEYYGYYSPEKTAVSPIKSINTKEITKLEETKEDSEDETKSEEN